MLVKKPEFKKWISLSAIVGFGVFLLYLYFFTDFTEVSNALEGTNIIIYGLAFVCIFGGAIFDTLTWKATLGCLSVKATFRQTFNLSWVGAFVDILIPGGLSGDVFKTYLLTKDPNVKGSRAAAAMIIKDVLELLVVLGFLILGLFLLAANYTISGIVMIAIGVTLFFLALPLLLIVCLGTSTRATEKVLKIMHRVVTKVRKKQSTANNVEEKIRDQIKEFHEGLMLIKTNPKSMVKPAAYQTIAMVLNVASLLFVFYALGAFIGVDKVIITNTVVNNIQGQGLALAGFAQIVSSTIFTVLGIDPILAIASSLLAGFASFWFRLLISFAFFQIIVFERCVPFFCQKCGGWRNWRKKTCNDPELLKSTSKKNQELPTHPLNYQEDDQQVIVNKKGG